MENKRPGMKKGTLLILAGSLLILLTLLLAAYNLWDESRAEQTSVILAEKLEEEIEKAEAQVPDYKKYPKMEMPEKEIEDRYYIGVLEIPVLNLELPVMSEWSYPNLKIAPCRYQGSAYLNNLVIAAHNYKCHFGNIKSLAQENQVTFTDMDGNVFQYRVGEMEILQPTDIEAMESSAWDLTLFTCTYGGQARVAIRCIGL